MTRLVRDKHFILFIGSIGGEEEVVKIHRYQDEVPETRLNEDPETDDNLNKHAHLGFDIFQD
jgi:hypothetical protein